MRTPTPTPSSSPRKQSGSPGQRLLRFALSFIAVVLVLDALFGERGLLEALRARRQQEALAISITRFKEHNIRLRDEARRLREEEPDAIERLARRELGLIKPGEMLFIIKDAESGGHE